MVTHLRELILNINSYIVFNFSNFYKEKNSLCQGVIFVLNSYAPKRLALILKELFINFK